ncbi:MAG TPA: YndJ family transporter, partial [Candidatus Limnocylindrales bacterium]
MTTAIGLLVWAAGLLLLPAPLAARIMLLGPLVVVPRLLGALPRRGWAAGLAEWPALLAAIVLTLSFAVPAGPAAALLTAPWLAVAGAGAAAAVIDGLRALPAILHPRRAADLGADASVVFLAVGATFATMDRLGAQPLGFSPTIVLLTATHFHFAGFGLLGLASIGAAARPALRGAVLGFIVGIPVTALGFTLPSTLFGALGALIVGGSGIVFALDLIGSSRTGRARWPHRVAGLALLVGMPMGIAWSVAILLGVRFLDVDAMVRSHGALNATAVLIAVVALPRRATSRGHATESMTTITLTTDIAAPIDRVFDLARDLDLHAASMAATGERAIGGRTAGRI